MAPYNFIISKGIFVWILIKKIGSPCAGTKIFGPNTRLYTSATEPVTSITALPKKQYGSLHGYGNQSTT